MRTIVVWKLYFSHFLIFPSFLLRENHSGMETPAPSEEDSGKKSCVRTIVVWKHFGGTYERSVYESCVRTIVVWKQLVELQ